MAPHFSLDRYQTVMYFPTQQGFGCGGFVQSLGWFQFRWPSGWSDETAKELVPVVFSAALWGRLWSGKLVCYHSDNMGVVSLLSKYSSPIPALMHLVRCLLFYAAYFKFQFVAQHVPGSANLVADAISRNNLSLFSLLVPQTPQMEIPQSLADLLVHQQPDWGSTNWIRLFRITLAEEWPQPLAHPTTQGTGDT